MGRRRPMKAPALEVLPAEKPVRDDDKREGVANVDTMLAFPEDDEHDKAAAEDEAKASAQDKVSRYSVGRTDGRPNR